MNLILHKPNQDSGLAGRYEHALEHATEVLIVSAYLTEWDKSLKLNPACRRFRMVIGKDFGITRKAACVDVMSWLPPRLKAYFLVADEIAGFHPKAFFWKEANGNAYAIIGSSNLTAAAFSTNYEANVFSQISPSEYSSAEKWVDDIIEYSVPVSSDWLDRYNEADRNPKRRPPDDVQKPEDDAVISMTLPRPTGMLKAIKERRKILSEYAYNRNGLMRLFRRCAEGQVSPQAFYASLPEYWGGEVGGRLQGKGWERRGQVADFRALAKSFLSIVEAKASARDDVVIEEIDRLAVDKNPARNAFFSEMLCLRFPALYPVVNQPVKKYLADIGFRAPRGASEGATYLDLAQKLRVSLKRSPDHPAKTLAELDTVIWLKYHD